MERAFVCTEDFPIAETKAGKLRGYQVGGTFYFLGVCSVNRSNLI